MGSAAPELERELLAVFEAEAPKEREGGEELGTVKVLEGPKDDARGAAPVALEAEVLVTVPEGVGDTVMLGDAPGLSEAVGLKGSVEVPVGVSVPEPHAWDAGLGVVREVPLLGRELLPEPDAEAFTAPEILERVDSGENAELELRLALGEGVPVPEGLSLPEAGGGTGV